MSEKINKIDICHESELDIDPELVSTLLSKMYKLFKDLMKEYDINIKILIEEKK